MKGIKNLVAMVLSTAGFAFAPQVMAVDYLEDHEMSDIAARGLDAESISNVAVLRGIGGISSLIQIANVVGTNVLPGGDPGQEAALPAGDALIESIIDILIPKLLFAYDNFSSDYTFDEESGVSMDEDGNVVLRIAGEIHSIRFENLRVAGQEISSFGDLEISDGTFNVKATVSYM